MTQLKNSCIQVTLPWFPKELNPNARVHWRVLYQRKKQYKEICWGLTKQACPLKPFFPEKQIMVRLTFYPPTRRRPDLDNCFAAMKSAIDGIALAIGVDDKRFGFQIIMSDSIGGMVKAQIF